MSFINPIYVSTKSAIQKVMSLAGRVISFGYGAYRRVGESLGLLERPLSDRIIEAGSQVSTRVPGGLINQQFCIPKGVVQYLATYLDGKDILSLQLVQRSLAGHGTRLGSCFVAINLSKGYKADFLERIVFALRYGIPLRFKCISFDQLPELTELFLALQVVMTKKVKKTNIPISGHPIDIDLSLIDIFDENQAALLDLLDKLPENVNLQVLRLGRIKADLTLTNLPRLASLETWAIKAELTLTNLPELTTLKTWGISAALTLTNLPALTTLNTCGIDAALTLTNLPALTTLNTWDIDAALTLTNLPALTTLNTWDIYAALTLANLPALTTLKIRGIHAALTLTNLPQLVTLQAHRISADATLTFPENTSEEDMTVSCYHIHYGATINNFPRDKISIEVDWGSFLP